MTETASTAPAAPAASLEVEELRARLRAAEEQLHELDARNRELENEVAYRGVKLSCARIALTRAKIAFDETSRQREQLVQEVAHDLRTPLTSIKGAAQNMLDGIAGPLNQDAHEYVHIIGEHAERLIGAVNWLLDALRVTSEPLDIESAELDVGELFASVVHSLRPIAEERQIALSVDAQQASAWVDPAKLRKVMENLLGNALKFTQAGGQVRVEVTSDAGNVYLRVRDSGRGMSAEELDRIFERYYRKANAGSASSGLGLVICREIVRLHGGEIQVESEPGRGSCFTVRLPKDGDTLKGFAGNCG